MMISEHSDNANDVEEDISTMTSNNESYDEMYDD